MHTRTFPTAPLALSALLLTVALGACGGGSSPPPPPPPPPVDGPINEGNAVQLANVATSMADVLDSAGSLGSLAPLPIPTVGFQGDGQAEMCPHGGTIEVTTHDEAPEGESSPGDYWEIAFSQCQANDTTLDGVFSLTLDSLTQTDTLTGMVFTWAIVAYHVTAPDLDCTKNASLSWGIEIDSEVPSLGWGLTGSWSTTTTSGGTSVSRSLSGLDVGCLIVIGSESEWIKRYWWNGTYETSESSLAGHGFRVTTLADFVAYGTDAAGPAEGKLEIFAGGDTLYLTALPDEVTVLLELDKGTDGEINWSEERLWSEL